MWAFSYSSRLQLLFELTEATVFHLGWLYQSSSINYYTACIVTSLRPFAHPVACCWMLLRVVGQSLKPVKLFSQQLPTHLLFRDRRSVAQQCWIRLHSSSNIVGATHAHYAWITKTYGLIPRCTAGPNIVGSCCIRLHAALERYSSEDFRALYFPILYWRPFLSKTVAVKTARNIMNFSSSLPFQR